MNRKWMLASVVLAIAVDASPAQTKDPDIEKLAAWMSGDFDTAQQVAGEASGAAAYTHVRAVLHIRPIEIPGLGGSAADRALYFEQALMGSEDEPYRQGVYLLTREKGVLINRGYRISNPSEFVGGWRKPELLKGLTADRLRPIQGCEAVLTRMSEERYNGIAGLNGTCPSTVRGATYMVSHSEITATTQTTLDQGFDDDGNHKWGPPPGTIGHIFRRKPPQ